MERSIGISRTCRFQQAVAALQSSGWFFENLHYAQKAFLTYTIIYYTMVHDSEFEKIILATGDIPSLPAVAAKVLQMAKDENLSLDELENTIEKDQAFSSRVLKMANSPFYGRNRSVDSISGAILLIGFKTMFSLVMAMAIKDVNRRFGLFEQKLWEHSLGVSMAASMLAKETRLAAPDEALMAGLIHDVGKTVLNNNIPDRYSMVVENVYQGAGAFVEIEDALLGFNHCTVGGFIARKWKLPKNIETVIEFHHSTVIPDHADGTYEPLCQIVAVADALVNSLGIGVAGPYAGEINLDSVGLSRRRFEEIQQQFSVDFEAQKESLTGE
ncbi:MAG TPA: HDOD domain-containing protein [Dissulfurispiraceae bacterium]|nr:HDOD domain-containing protein [Dissulfurispiraceae bacterium]